MSAKLSVTMAEAIVQAKHYGSLERWPGGFWTFAGATASHTISGLSVPEWYVGVGTVDALCRRGLLKVTERRGSPAYMVRVELAQSAQTEEPATEQKD